MNHFIVECRFDEPLNEAEDKRISSTVDSYLGQHEGRWIRSYYSKDRQRLICEFEAPDSETVAKAWEEADCPIESVWSAEVFEREAVPQAGG
jgi:hypothetical protein